MTSIESLPNETGVLVIGGGPNGLVASILLSMRGIDHRVLERRDGTQKAPAAHVIRHRPLEVLSQLGVREEIREQIAPLAMKHINWCTTLGGPEVGRLDLRGERPHVTDPLDEAWINLSQSRLEPILARRAEELAPGSLAYGVTAGDLTQDKTGVTTTVHDSEGHEHSIRSRWVIAADGAGSRTRQRLNIEMEGQGPLANFMMAHFRADLTKWIDHRPGPLFWIMNPESSGTLIVHDPKCAYVFMTPSLGIENEAETMDSRLRQALGEEVDAEIEIVSTDAWMPFNQVADRYREGRVFLAGDAAHRFPPTGGLGLNTGILDVHNLVWKLAMVDAGLAEDGLLESYEAECRPAARRNADQSLGNMIGLASVNQAIGPVTSLSEIKIRMASLTEDEKAALQGAIDSQFDHFASDGHYPRAVDSSDEHPTEHGPCDYAGFTVLGRDSAEGAAIAQSLHQSLGAHVAFTEVTTGPNGYRLTRPDGLVISDCGEQSDPGSTLLAAIKTTLRG